MVSNIDPLATAESSDSFGTKEPNARSRHANAGSITLGVLALTCLVLGVIQGLVPIFLIEAAAFGGLAWLCAARWPLSERALVVVLIASPLLAGLVGVTLDQDTFGPRYRYLSQGSTQYRVDEKAGRTDRLGSGGWRPVAYDKYAAPLPLNAELGVSLKNGNWQMNYPFGDGICFTAENGSGYVLQKVLVGVTVTDRDGANVKDLSYDPYLAALAGSMAEGPGVITLKKKDGELIDSGETSKVCGPAQGVIPQGGNWSQGKEQAYGWKR